MFPMLSDCKAVDTLITERKKCFDSVMEIKLFTSRRRLETVFTTASFLIIGNNLRGRVPSPNFTGFDVL